MTRRGKAAAARRPSPAVIGFLLGLSTLSCTDQSGEVGVYLALTGGREGGVIHRPLPETGPPFDSPADSAAVDRCVPGRYDGTFSCNFDFAAACDQNTGSGGLVWTGPLSLTLITVPSGEFLAVSGASLNASSGGFLLNGPLSGTLDCRARQFTGSFDGTYSGTALPPLPGVNGQLSGPIQAGYDPRQPALVNGSWCLTATNPMTSRTDPCADIPTGQPGSCLAGSCVGTWSAVYVPGT